MATRSANVSQLSTDAVLVSWEGITEADTGAAAALDGYSARSVQVLGDFTTSGAITFEGSNDGVTWATLNDEGGTTLVVTAASVRSIREVTRYVRPRATAGTAVDMDVHVFATRR